MRAEEKVTGFSGAADRVLDNLISSLAVEAVCAFTRLI